MAGTLNLLVGASLAAAQLNGGNPSLGGGGGGTQGAAAPAPTVTWTEEEFQPGVFGPDDAVDIIHWIDPVTEIPYVYMTGFQTTANGGTVFATYKYKARTEPGGGDQQVAQAFFPSLGVVAPNDRFKAVSLTLDNRTGDIYVTGQAGDPNFETGLDYLTIKYDKILGQRWVSTYNGPGNGDDVPVDIDFVAGENDGEGVVLVTGSSPRLPLNLDLDIATVAYNVGTGDRTTLWEDLGGDQGVGVRRYGGTGGGNDSAVGVTGLGILNLPAGEGLVEGLLELQAYVAGTAVDSHGGAQSNKDIVALAYANTTNPSVTGVQVGVRLFDRVTGGDDIATGLATYRNGQGISTRSMDNFVTICGYTPNIDMGASLNDTDYVVLNYIVFPNSFGVNWLLDGWTGVKPARFFDGLASTEVSDDRALAIGRPNHFVFNDGIVWVTGRVREEDGVDYDIGTVVYNTFDPLGLEIDSWRKGLDLRSGGSDDRAVAIDVHNDIAYIGGWTSLSSATMFFASKYELFSASPTWNKIFRNTFGPDSGEGIISVTDGFFTPVFTTGGSTNSSNGDNQFTVRIDQP